MPAKGHLALGVKLVNVAVRLPENILNKVDAHIETLRAASPWARVGRSEALRDLVQRGLQGLQVPAPPAHTLPGVQASLSQPAAWDTLPMEPTHTDTEEYAQLLAWFQHHTQGTAQDIGAAVGLSRQRAAQRLGELVQQGQLVSKVVGRFKKAKSLYALAPSAV